MMCSSVRLDQVVYAKTDMAARSKGITAFIIEKGIPGYVPFEIFNFTSLIMGTLDTQRERLLMHNN